MRTRSVVFGEYMAMAMEARALSAEWGSMKNGPARSALAGRRAVADGNCYFLLIEFNALCLRPSAL